MGNLLLDLRGAARVLGATEGDGVSPMDPVAFVGAAAVVMGIALVASFVPSWRAASTDPIRALRHQ